MVIIKPVLITIYIISTSALHLIPEKIPGTFRKIRVRKVIDSRLGRVEP